MLKLRSALIATLFFLFSALPVFAQSGTVVVDDPDRILEDAGAVRAAAERLADEGAEVVIIAARDAGSNTEAADRYVDSRLQQLGLADSTQSLRGNQIVFAFAPQPTYAGIWYVARYKAALDPAIEQIYRQEMQPLFTRGEFSAGMVAGIDAVRTTLNPPPSPVPWVVGGATAVGLAGAAGVSALRKRKAAEAVVLAARQRMEEARRTAGVALADLGRRVTLAHEKAQYDRLSYAPHDVEQIVTLQSRGEARFVEAQQAFDAAEEAHRLAERPGASEYDALMQRFAEARRLAEEAAQHIADAEQRRLVLDRSGASAPYTGETQHLQ